MNPTQTLLDEAAITRMILDYAAWNDAGDWDAVVVAHSSFKKIDMPRDMQEEILQEQIDAVITAIEESKQNDGG
ncbi:MAG TPA: hypothetical protein PKA59_01055, partial [Chakrabartia sp.]|nr:hypothetical protein [Chakrabartia sp.]